MSDEKRSKGEPLIGSIDASNLGNQVAEVIKSLDANQLASHVQNIQSQLTDNDSQANNTDTTATDNKE